MWALSEMTDNQTEHLFVVDGMLVAFIDEKESGSWRIIYLFLYKFQI